ncbi:MAG: hypothetical protein JO089_01445, partial [Alphaproteobacteria bacterium]|nr:hypothetical protein [Alphaproteobacteria bacterium]
MQRIEPFYLDDRHFAAAIAIALLVHLLLFTAWQMIPAAQVAEIPVRVLNLKLGDIENIPDLPSGENEVTSLSVEQELSHQMDNAAPAVPAKPSTAVWKMIKKAISQPRLPAPSAQEAERPQPTPPTEQTAQADAAKKIEDNSALAAALAQAAQQFVRQQPSFDYRAVPGAARGAGSPLGNSTRSDAEEATRYEQIISAWMDKFKYLPAEA